MAINQLINNSSGTDWGEYNPFYRFTNVFTGKQNEFTTVLDIQGEGYLSKALINNNSSIRVTLDGDLIYLGNQPNSATDRCIGFVEQSQVIPIDASNLGVMMNSTSLHRIYGLTEFPNYSGSYSVIVPKPIFFKKSLLVEVNNHGTSTRVYVVAGGIKL